MSTLGIAFLAQLILYLLVLLWNDYVGTLFSLVLGFICLGIWVVARLVEWVERSRVPSRYYQLMVVGFLAPLVALLLFGLLRGGFSWLKI